MSEGEGAGAFPKSGPKAWHSLVDEDTGKNSEPTISHQAEATKAPPVLAKLTKTMFSVFRVCSSSEFGGGSRRATGTARPATQTRGCVQQAPPRGTEGTPSLSSATFSMGQMDLAGGPGDGSPGLSAAGNPWSGTTCRRGGPRWPQEAVFSSRILLEPTFQSTRTTVGGPPSPQVLFVLLFSPHSMG